MSSPLDTVGLPHQSRNNMKFFANLCALGALIWLSTAVVFAQGAVFTPETLAQYDGKDGRKAYYAYEGVVYDVTTSTLWKIGEHFGHTAGKDLTGKLEGAPHGDDIVKAMPVVGTYAVNSEQPAASSVQTAVQSPEPKASSPAWYEGRIRFAGLTILGWTGVLLAVVFVLNFMTCFALPWSKVPLPWRGSRIGPDALDQSPVHLNFASIHKYFAWATVVLGILHGVLGLLQVLGLYL